MIRAEGSAGVILVLLAITAGFYGEIAQADISGLGNEGWHTWRIESVEDAPEMCCFGWKSGTTTRRQCDLDGRNGGFSSSDNSVSPGGSAQIYALMSAGTVTRIRAFSSDCPVIADSTITDLGRIETDDSVDWLEQHVSGNATSNAIAAIAIHNGPAALNVLLDTAKVGNEEDNREDAIFWMAQVRVGETEEQIKRHIFDDENADIREHAAFSYSQSRATDIADTLIRQGRNDDDPDVRSQAWFWLAQTEAVESEEAIRYALLNDEDEDVREEAVFALSQLPEDRAVKALAEILEDKSLSMDLREQALFWLAQTESDEAFEYIDRLLSDN